MSSVLNRGLTLNQLIFSACLEVECVSATPSLEAFCSSSDPVSSEAHWLMPHYRFSHNIVLYTLGLLGGFCCAGARSVTRTKTVVRTDGRTVSYRHRQKHCCVLFVLLISSEILKTLQLYAWILNKLV